MLKMQNIKQSWVSFNALFVFKQKILQPPIIP